MVSSGQVTLCAPGFIRVEGDTAAHPEEAHQVDAEDRAIVLRVDVAGAEGTADQTDKAGRADTMARSTDVGA